LEWIGVMNLSSTYWQHTAFASFEPIRGSALDIAGRGIANPIGTFWTAVMMLQHLGEINAAARLMGAIEHVTSSRVFTPDLGGRATTTQVTEALCTAIEAPPWSRLSVASGT
jgi:tartrate dehydrogenase/decarboxylase / D-malate dehydrogenase